MRVIAMLYCIRLLGPLLPGLTPGDSGPAQPAVPPRSLARTWSGTWRGTSICTAAGKPACHDETVVYRARGATPDSIELVMNKIVAGAEEEMGVVRCGGSGTRVACPMRDYTWRFVARRDTVHGTLVNGAGVVWRNIVVLRADR